MLKRFSLVVVSVVTALGMCTPVQAEEWKMYNAGNFYLNAPASWLAFKGDVPNSAMLISADPMEIETYVFAAESPFRDNELPDIYGMMDFFRKIAGGMKCEMTMDPAVGGKPIAGQDAIGAYAACAKDEAELRVYVTTIERSHELLVVIQRYARSSANLSESYRYGILDSIIIPKKTNRSVQPGIYSVGGPYGGGTGLGLYMGWLTVEIQPDNRYRMLQADVIGAGLAGVVNSNERGRFIVDGEELILLSDAMPRWPAKNPDYQLPRRVTLR